MPWTTLTSGKLSDANDINNNFDFLYGGSILPRSSVSVSFQNTDSAYDLGSDSYRWNNIYCNKINYISLTSENKSVYTLISEIIFTTTASSIEFSGLNGDDKVFYILKLSLHLIGTNTIWMYLNNDSASNYGYQERGNNTVAYGVRNSATGIPIIHRGGAATSYRPAIVELFSKSGTTRIGTYEYVSDQNFLTSEGHGDGCFVWNNSGDTITSIKIFFDATNKARTGTSIQLWGRS